MAAAAPQSYLFVSNRNQTIRGLTGHAITFVKGKATHVPKSMHSAVIEKGIMPCDEDGKPLPEKGEELVAEAQPSVIKAPDDGDSRAEQISAVIKAMVERNDPKEFTGGGTPNAEAVSMRLGWKTDQKEVRQVWVKVRPALLGNDN